MKIQFVEPPKDYWFVMGEYLPPPHGILQLAAFVENKMDNLEIEVLLAGQNDTLPALTGIKASLNGHKSCISKGI